MQIVRDEALGDLCHECQGNNCVDKIKTGGDLAAGYAYACTKCGAAWFISSGGQKFELRPDSLPT